MKKRNLLYNAAYEHDACGTGFIASSTGETSHRILQFAIEGVCNLTHRGAINADAKTGDGAGILTEIPYKIFIEFIKKLKKQPPAILSNLGIGVFFLPNEKDKNYTKCINSIETHITNFGMEILGWRTPPINTAGIGKQALSTMPNIKQLVINNIKDIENLTFENKLYLAKKAIEKDLSELDITTFYITSLSNKTIIYKGMLVAPQLANFYEDLQNPNFETSLAVFHQRYSTNTLPNWYLAQPLRLLAHNGEINTLQGNVNWMKARESDIKASFWGKYSDIIAPVIQEKGSDSSNLDNVLELLVQSGRNPMHALAMLIPEAWENISTLKSQWKDFYQYHASISEPWDGPAAVAFSDGQITGASLDRNGLRPARYEIYKDGIVCMASETGILERNPEDIIENGRLGPGEMLAVDTKNHKILKNNEIKNIISEKVDYSNWIKNNLKNIPNDQETNIKQYTNQAPPLTVQRFFLYSSEEINLVLKPMIEKAIEPIGSMGDDSPLAILSRKPKLLYSFFRQKFAQVTNPPIDPLRERIVMSLKTYLGAKPNFIEKISKNTKIVSLESPILTNTLLSSIKTEFTETNYANLDCTFNVSDGIKGIENHLTKLKNQAIDYINNGKSILILSDKGVNEQKASLPMLLAIGYIHHSLILSGLRMKVSLVAETAEARDMHQICCLIGYGANAVNPYLALNLIGDLIISGQITDIDPIQAINNYKLTLEKQILKIMSKMGISSISAYHGAQIFEILGINNNIVKKCFSGTPSPISGIELDDIASIVLQRHKDAFELESPKLNDHGEYRFRKTGESHSFNPFMVRLLHKAIDSNDQNDYKAFVEKTNETLPMNIRDLLEIIPFGPKINLNQVEPAKNIVKRFMTGSMSLGALSPEAHESLVIAMNTLEGKSNTGEGGEDPQRYRTKIDNISKNSKGKQVASGRFGVTTEYLAMAEELEIKMAQGSKPGEGGQLPGHKVVSYIAKIRHTQPGVTLISPPPHHDIYSIEDLAQLIYDLKTVNPRCKVSVKLVSETGVGTIAAGVAKGYADVIQISGMEGGTGASPLISIKQAGTPWEIGLAETQQTLVKNNLRERITLRTDGGIKSGRDVLIGTLLGAEEFVFGTSALLAIGCKMARQCHLNTCPVGVATQDPKLREKFKGTPEHLIRYLFFIAEELRTYMAKMGVDKLDTIVGRADLLKQISIKDHPHANKLDLSKIHAIVDPSKLSNLKNNQKRNNREESEILDDLIKNDVPEILDKNNHRKNLTYKIKNGNRTTGGKLAGDVALKYGNTGLSEDKINIKFTGRAGQSFGAFLTPGFKLELIGAANDYVGKGLTGGKIAIYPPKNSQFEAHENVIVGNTVLYGATGGYLFASGKAGERFAVRNSGATAVIEGTGDHCCEYMTGGLVIVLGNVGKNTGAGMSGGIAFILDENNTLKENYNPEMVKLDRVQSIDDKNTINLMIKQHLELTKSSKAKSILDNWNDTLLKFYKLSPKEVIASNNPREEQRTIRDSILSKIHDDKP